jgi:hypothetical protein
MPAQPRVCALTLVLLSTCLAAIPFRANAQNAKPELSSLPLAFESNKGQTTEPYRFLARRGSMETFFPVNGVHVVLPGRKSTASKVQIRWSGANTSSSVDGEELLRDIPTIFAGMNRRDG